MIALAVASLLAVFLVYQVAAGSGQLIVTVGQLRSDKDGAREEDGAADRHRRQLCRRRPAGAAQAPFTMRRARRGDAQTVAGELRRGGAVPDAFKAGRRIIVTGQMADGTFVAQPDSLVTKCPSKYSGGGGGA